MTQGCSEKRSTSLNEYALKNSIFHKSKVYFPLFSLIAMVILIVWVGYTLRDSRDHKNIGEEDSTRQLFFSGFVQVVQELRPTMRVK